MRKYSEEFVNNKIYIYTLCNPNTGDIRYVGVSKHPHIRYKEHIRESKVNNTYKCCWIRSIKYEPKMEIIDECYFSDFAFWEKYYISLFKSWGFKLTNLCDGGKGPHGYKFSEESKKKRSINSIGEKNWFYNKKHEEKTKRIMSAKKIGIYDGNKNHMYNKSHNAEAKIKMREKKIGIYDGDKNPRAKKLYQYSLNDELIKIWNTAKECSDFYGISKGNISHFAKYNTHKNNEIPYKILHKYIFKFN
jgi:group I intron endonuclease